MNIKNAVSEKKTYSPPEVKRWGTIADLTRVGLSRQDGDFKGGSILIKIRPPFKKRRPGFFR
jgi:hypothetical protein